MLPSATCFEVQHEQLLSTMKLHKHEPNSCNAWQLLQDLLDNDHKMNDLYLARREEIAALKAAQISHRGEVRPC